MTIDEAREILAPYLYTRPQYYIGEDFYGTYSVATKHRDSDPIERANFQVMDELVSDASEAIENDDDMPFITRASHWAVGWVDSLRVPATNERALIAAAEAHLRLENYPILDEDLATQIEVEENEAAGMVQADNGEWYYPDKDDLTPWDEAFWEDDEDEEV